ncbi:maf/YceF/YhdE family protein [Candidatus Paraburkholderia kirkii]|nr:maf/YceF/YhdE family protein [Candidatus Paraburkholderia kirkii]
MLKRLRVPFDVVKPDVDEAPLAGEAPESTAVRVADRADVLVIGSDQVATFDGRQIGKPGTHENAVAQLRAMRGRSVEFHSALCLFDSRTENVQSADIVTRVRFRHYSDAQIEAYLHAETPYDCAGNAKSEGLGIALLEAIESDDPTALIGLPLIALSGMLETVGFPVLGAA